VQLVKAGSDGIFVKTDVTKEDDVRLPVEETIKVYGRLDAFNNAGIEELMTPLVDQASDTFDRIMNVNVKGVWLCMKYEIAQMIKSEERGAIVKHVFCNWRYGNSTCINL
jgi:NAD(P)-dependent dehydrogenase (short-subunit alcohol dehydrogenase family)